MTCPQSASLISTNQRDLTLRQTETIVGSGTLDCLVWGWGGGPMMRWMLMLSFRLFR